jgi:aldose 1-epimerase
MSLGGEEHLLRHGDYTAAVTEVGGGLRFLRHGERDLLLGYAVDGIRRYYRGALLAPWPNRVVDGRYRFDGESFRLDLSEPERGHALHGLVVWSRFAVRTSDPSSVSLTHSLVPRTGYPFALELTVSYRLGDGGLTCSVTARNIGQRRAPYGVAPHPYLVAGHGRVDDWALELPAEQVMEVTADRLVPTGLRPVAGSTLDFREERTIGTTRLDHCFTALRPADDADDADDPHDPYDGRVHARLLSADGHGVECAWDAATLPWVQVHTADLPDPAESRRGLALEPMTCPPDAFNSGTDLVVLDPGEEHTAEWALRAV